jgi:hypothetical protein
LKPKGKNTNTIDYPKKNFTKLQELSATEPEEFENSEKNAGCMFPKRQLFTGYPTKKQDA